MGSANQSNLNCRKPTTFAREVLQGGRGGEGRGRGEGRGGEREGGGEGRGGEREGGGEGRGEEGRGERRGEGEEGMKKLSI